VRHEDAGKKAAQKGKKTKRRRTHNYHRKVFDFSAGAKKPQMPSVRPRTLLHSVKRKKGARVGQAKEIEKGWKKHRSFNHCQQEGGGPSK